MAFFNGVCNKYVSSCGWYCRGDIDTRDLMYYASALVETPAFLTHVEHRNFLRFVIYTCLSWIYKISQTRRFPRPPFEGKIMEDSRLSSRDRMTRWCYKSPISAFQCLPCEIIVTHSRECITLHLFTTCAYFCIIFISIFGKSL